MNKQSKKHVALAEYAALMGRVARATKTALCALRASGGSLSVSVLRSA